MQGKTASSVGEDDEAMRRGCGEREKEREEVVWCRLLSLVGLVGVFVGVRVLGVLITKFVWVAPLTVSDGEQSGAWQSVGKTAGTAVPDHGLLRVKMAGGAAEVSRLIWVRCPAKLDFGVRLALLGRSSVPADLEMCCCLQKARLCVASDCVQIAQNTGVQIARLCGL